MVRAMKPAFPLLLPALVAGLIAVAYPAAAGDKVRPVVVELFTSQGCNSCPPADTLLGQLASRKDVLAMSLPITYWDMLGWKDTLGSDANTRRQKAYADLMKRGGIYTPQVVVDGVDDIVGSREQKIDAAITARQADESTVPVSLGVVNGLLHVSIGGGKAAAPATVWLFDILDQKTVTITGGENQGHTLTYRNVVRDVRAIGTWKGEPLAFDLPKNDGIPSHDGVAVLVQQGNYGRIIGAAMLSGAEFQAAH
jgi:hypothetical protein